MEVAQLDAGGGASLCDAAASGMTGEWHDAAGGAGFGNATAGRRVPHARRATRLESGAVEGYDTAATTAASPSVTGRISTRDSPPRYNHTNERAMQATHLVESEPLSISMEEVTGATGSLISKLRDLLSGKYCLNKRLKEEVKSLACDLETTHAALEEMAQVPPDQLDDQDKHWARDIREASYYMEKSLDTFVVRVERGRGNDPVEKDRFKSSAILKSLLTKFTELKPRNNFLIRAINNFKKRLQEVNDRQFQAFDAYIPPSTPTAKVDVDVQGTPGDDQIIKEQLDRCIEYSQKALQFAIPTFFDYTFSGSSTGHTIFTKVSMIGFFIAICSDLFLLKMKPKWSRNLVYVSWFSLVFMTTVIFMSLNKGYVYGILIVPLMFGAALLQHKLCRSQEHQRPSTGELDYVFKLSAQILSWGSLVTAVVSTVRRRIDSAPGNHRTVCPAGFLFFFTVVVGLYLMMVTTVRHAALTLHAKYLGVLLIGLVVVTIITTFITFVRL